MGRHNLCASLKTAHMDPTSSSPVKLLYDPTTGAMLAYGTSVPSAVAGYAIGCIFIHTDGAEGTALYQNEGSATSCTFNAIASLTAAQEALLGATAGTVTASKAVIVDANKDAGDFRNLDAVNIDAGASGTAGTVDVFPTTASKGKLAISCTDQSGDTTVSLVAGAMGQATTVTIPDPGATAANVGLGHDMTPGTGISAGTGTVCEHSVSKIGGLKRTTILIDLTGLNSGNADGDIIGKNSQANCHLGQIVAATNGTLFAGLVTCLETPAGGEPDIDLYSATESTGSEDAAISGLTAVAALDAGADWTAGTSKGLTAFPAAAKYLYLVASGGATDATYTAGIFMIELWGT